MDDFEALEAIEQWAEVLAKASTVLVATEHAVAMGHFSRSRNTYTAKIIADRRGVYLPH